MMSRHLLIFSFLVILAASMFAQSPALAYRHLKISSNHTFSPSTIYAGDVFSINIPVSNQSSNVLAENVRVSVNISKEFSDVLSSSSLPNINPNGSETAVLKVRANADIIPGSYVLPITVSYTSQGNAVTETSNVTVTITKLSKLNIGDVRLNADYFYADQKIIVSSKISNDSSFEERKVNVKLVPSAGNFNGFNLMKQTSIIMENLPANTSQEASFELVPSPDLEPGFYSFYLIASSQDANSADIEPFSIHINSKPELVLSNLDFTANGSKEKKLLQGTVFTISIQLENIGKEKAKAVKAILSTPDDIVGGKETFIGTIDPDDSSSAVFDLTVLDDAVEGKKAFTITFSYLDENGDEQTILKSFDLYVFQKPAESIIPQLVLVLLILVALYFVIQAVFRQLRLQKHREPK